VEPGSELRPPRPSRQRVLLRRLVAVVVVVFVLGGITAALATRGSSHAAQPTTTVRQLRQFRILFPEGFTRAQMAARVGAVAKIAEHESHGKVKLAAAAYRAATKRPRAIPGFGAKKLALEGFLFPDTYDFDRTSTSALLVRVQLQEFAAKWKTLNLSHAQSKNLTPYDVLTIASMIEAEAQVPSERPLVAAVIYNRLHAHMPLQIDATTRYGLHIPPTKSLTNAELNSKNPYNTRHRLGLTPTPIDNPGLASLEAAANPAHVDYLYFVRKPDHKHHYFTANYQDFLQHEAQYGY
jgi:peptidoglycan lytic transglycosylase G